MNVAEKPVRRKKSEITREKLLAAAAKVVGEIGYDRASIVKIAEAAGIASGGFYYYFASRNELFEELLPTLGKEMISFVVSKIRDVPWGVEREVVAFEAYLAYLVENPEFLRVFSEAQVYAPAAYKKNFQATLDDFYLSLRAQRVRGHLDIDEDQIRPLAYFLTGIRNYISQLLLDGEEGASSEAIAKHVALYRRIILDGVFRESHAAKRVSTQVPA